MNDAVATNGLPSGMLEHYPASQSHFDEVLCAKGHAQSQWREILQTFEGLGPSELKRRSRESQQLLREYGVTYNVYGDPRGTSRPWALDPLPMLLTSQEWNALEAGLQQRAELLNLILTDIYGPQKLLREQLLPADLIYSHPGFLYPCYNQGEYPQRPLVLYAADIARNPAGQFVVIGDRSQAPSGSGYALENRVVMSRIMPHLYRHSHIKRLATYFQALRETLGKLASGSDPRVVLLTPGEENETYFEHAYLANYLGYNLVQGNDLTVRDNKVWLKTLDGLQRVDVIFRRVDDTYCDPLELEGTSLLGTPALVQAFRSQSVVVVNPLGSGVVENPGLLPFLPQLCRTLLGEELKLPSAPTWWCGQEKECNHVLQNLDRMVIRAISPSIRRTHLPAYSMNVKQREQLIQEIRLRPYLYAGQEFVQLSTVPALSGTQLEPRKMSLRCFLVNSNDSYAAMPGGLTRIAPQRDSPIVSNQTGGMSKDTLVLATEPQERVTLLFSPALRREMLIRRADNLPSRVAENLFWLGRYTERADSMARLLREILWRLLDADSDSWTKAGLPALLRIVTHHTTTYPGFTGPKAQQLFEDPSAELLSVIYDAERTGTLRFNVKSTLRSAGAVRERLSDDTWRITNSLDHFFHATDDLGEALQCVERLIIALAGFAGLVTESTSRGLSWKFVELGRRVERALKMGSLLRLCYPPRETENAETLNFLLAVNDTWKTYRLRYGSQIQPDAVLEVMLLDETHPRSIGYQIVRMQEIVADLPGRLPYQRLRPEERYLLEIRSAIRLSDMGALSKQEQPGKLPPELKQILKLIETRLDELTDTIVQAHFSHTLDMPQQLIDF